VDIRGASASGTQSAGLCRRIEAALILVTERSIGGFLWERNTNKTYSYNRLPMLNLANAQVPTETPPFGILAHLGRLSKLPSFRERRSIEIASRFCTLRSSLANPCSAEVRTIKLCPQNNFASYLQTKQGRGKPAPKKLRYQSD